MALQVRNGRRQRVSRRPLRAADIVVCNSLPLSFERRQFRNELLLGLLEDLLRVKVIDVARLEPLVAPGAVVHDVGHEIAYDGRGPLIDVGVGTVHFAHRFEQDLGAAPRVVDLPGHGPIMPPSAWGVYLRTRVWSLVPIRSLPTQSCARPNFAVGSWT